MQHIDLLVFGRLKEPFWRAACGEYTKRLGALCRLNITELPPAPLPQAPGPKQVAAALEQEAQALTQKLPRGAALVALCSEGKALSSEAWAAWLAEHPTHLALVVGSSHGLAPALGQKATLKLSLSSMTFPHQLARVMVLEQLYRGLQINAGAKYHK